MPRMMTVTTLTDGGQEPVTVAQALHDFLAAAQTSLDLALYDFQLDPGLEELVVDTIEAARQARRRRADRLQRRLPRADPGAAAAEDAPEDIARLAVPTKPIAGIPDLMHHKYVVRDGSSVWTGSTNWTDDSWSREENVIAVDRLLRARARVHARLRAALGRRDRRGGGRVEPRPVHVDGIEIRPWFCPGYGDALSHRIAKAIGRAKRRVRICSPVITAAPVLGDARQVIADGKVDVAGAVDMPQIEDVQRQWGPTGVRSWKLPLLLQVIGSGRFAGKRSTPWGPGTVHDYMHAKMTVADDVVFLGSFNLSHSGEMNAENVLEIHDPALAERLAGFVDGVRARYPVASLSALRLEVLWTSCRSSAAPGCPPARVRPDLLLANLSNCSRLPDVDDAEAVVGLAAQWKRRRGSGAPPSEAHQLQHLVVLLERRALEVHLDRDCHGETSCVWERRRDVRRRAEVAAQISSRRVCGGSAVSSPRPIAAATSCAACLRADRFVTFQRRCSGGGPFVSARIIAAKVAPKNPTAQMTNVATTRIPGSPCCGGRCR